MSSSPDSALNAERLLALHLQFGQALTPVEPATAADTAAAITELSVASIPGVEQASISEGRHGRFRTLASTGAMATGGDLLQYELGCGPCVDALTGEVVYHTGNVTADSRWPEFGRRATAETGTRSLLSYRLYFDNGIYRVTSLNLYSTELEAFADTAHTVATVLATHSARAMTTAVARDRAAALQQALNSGREVGTAMGIVMAAHKVTRDQALSLLRIASQNSNRKLIDVATDVVDTRLSDERSFWPDRPRGSSADSVTK